VEANGGSGSEPKITKGAPENQSSSGDDDDDDEPDWAVERITSKRVNRESGELE
jgi:hypothetical protein